MKKTPSKDTVGHTRNVVLTLSFQRNLIVFASSWGVPCRYMWTIVRPRMRWRSCESHLGACVDALHRSPSFSGTATLMSSQNMVPMIWQR